MSPDPMRQLCWTALRMPLDPHLEPPYPSPIRIVWPIDCVLLLPCRWSKTPASCSKVSVGMFLKTSTPNPYLITTEDQFDWGAYLSAALSVHQYLSIGSGELGQSLGIEARIFKEFQGC